jgi:hypothetical protein
MSGLRITACVFIYEVTMCKDEHVNYILFEVLRNEYEINRCKRYTHSNGFRPVVSQITWDLIPTD